MRIQHNIMAMNAYRNYNTNTKALSGNLEKLSSGYKINRAGDDAAGLAISEKMRAQITGLDAAQKNVKDGVSLVKTAEGAMQEIQDMLNRMDYLATQSANGTYDNEVDRANLQKEVTSLKSEINRIADSANFNGIKLLDGSLAGSGSSSGVSTLKTDLATTKIEATAGKYVAAALDAAPTADGDTASFTLALDNGKSYTVDLTFKTDGTNAMLVDADGNEYKATAAGATKAEIGDALAAALKEKVGKDFTISNNAGALTFEAKTKGTTAPQVTGLSQSTVIGGTAAGPKALAITATAATDAKVGIKGATFTEYDGTNEDDAVFTLNGKKFVIADTANVDVSKLSDKGIVVISGALGTDDNAIAQQLAQPGGHRLHAQLGQRLLPLLLGDGRLILALLQLLFLVGFEGGHRLAHVGAGNDRRALLQQVLDGGQGRADALIVRDRAGGLVLGDIEVAAQKDLLALDIDVLYGFFVVVHASNSFQTD